MTDPNYSSSLTTHIQAFFGRPCVQGSWDPKFLARRGLRLSSLCVPPSEKYAFFSYVSCGIGEMSVEDGPCEYVLCSPFDTDEHRELVSMLGAAIAARGTAFRDGDVIAIGRPWLVGSFMERLLVSRPYPFGPKLEEADQVAAQLRILWLLPIYEDEAQILEMDGLEALEQRFENAEIDLLDPLRTSVVRR